MAARIRFFERFLLITAVVTLLSAAPANAQSIGFGVGSYHSINPQSRATGLSFDVDRRPLWSLQFFFSSILNCKRTSRLGIRFSYLSARTRLREPVDPGWPGRTELEHRMMSVLMSYQRKLYNPGALFFGMSLSAGLSFIGDDEGGVFEVCTPPFCALEEARLSLQPGIDWIVRAYKGVGIHLSGRYNLISGDKKAIYPFSSGFLFEGGLFFEIPHRDSD